jgi:hypothetical protein
MIGLHALNQSKVCLAYTQLSKTKNKIIVLKNDMCCLACFKEISELAFDSKYKVSLIIASPNETSFAYEKVNLLTKYPKLNKLDFSFEKRKEANVIEKQYKRKSYFAKNQVLKTPHIIVIDSLGKEVNWEYNRIFCYGDMRINDTLKRLIGSN